MKDTKFETKKTLAQVNFHGLRPKIFAGLGKTY